MAEKEPKNKTNSEPIILRVLPDELGSFGANTKHSKRERQKGLNEEFPNISFVDPFAMNIAHRLWLCDPASEEAAKIIKENKNRLAPYIDPDDEHSIEKMDEESIAQSVLKKANQDVEGFHRSLFDYLGDRARGYNLDVKHEDKSFTADDEQSVANTWGRLDQLIQQGESQADDREWVQSVKNGIYELEIANIRANGIELVDQLLMSSGLKILDDLYVSDVAEIADELYKAGLRYQNITDARGYLRSNFSVLAKSERLSIEKYADRISKLKDLAGGFEREEFNFERSKLLDEWIGKVQTDGNDKLRGIRDKLRDASIEKALDITGEEFNKGDVVVDVIDDQCDTLIVGNARKVRSGIRTVRKNKLLSLGAVGLVALAAAGIALNKCSSDSDVQPASDGVAATRTTQAQATASAIRGIEIAEDVPESPRQLSQQDAKDILDWADGSIDGNITFYKGNDNFHTSIEKTLGELGANDSDIDRFQAYLTDEKYNFDLNDKSQDQDVFLLPTAKGNIGADAITLIARIPDRELPHETRLELQNNGVHGVDNTIDAIDELVQSGPVQASSHPTSSFSLHSKNVPYYQAESGQETVIGKAASQIAQPGTFVPPEAIQASLESDGHEVRSFKAVEKGGVSEAENRGGADILQTETGSKFVKEEVISGSSLGFAPMNRTDSPDAWKVNVVGDDAVEVRQN